MSDTCTICGGLVEVRQQMENMNRFLEEHQKNRSNDIVGSDLEDSSKEKCLCSEAVSGKEEGTILPIIEACYMWKPVIPPLEVKGV